MKKVLIVDDEFGARESLKVILDSDYEIVTAENYDMAWTQIAKGVPDLILLDICMPDKNGLELLRDLRSKGIKTPVVMVTATKTLKTAVEAMKQGAADYVTKPYDVEEIRAIVLENIDSPQKGSEENASRTSFSREDIIGYNTSLKPVFKLVDRLGATDSTVLILGESGTGKELIAKSIHESSVRMGKNFVPVHLSAISETLIESELFGHVKGSFTGADKDRKGAFELGNGGTIFLDEIGEIKESVQIKLLRVIQEKEYKPVGDSHTKRTNARIIAATNKDLYALVQEGKFRADLYYRLNVVPIHLPPLRERSGDIPALVAYLVKKISGRLKTKTPLISEGVIQAFMKFSWPGNIREIENTLENMMLLTDREVLSEIDLPKHLCFDNNDPNGKVIPSTSCEDPDKENLPEKEDSPQDGNVLSALEREAIQTALLRNNGVLTSAAKYLGTTRRILKYKMDKLGIDKSDLFRN